MKPASPYDPCPCNSGKKYRFCCAKKPVELDN
ncbi:SEC-C metal-binding domain-containing protein [Peribacillus frigoritolerans]